MAATMAPDLQAPGAGPWWKSMGRHHWMVLAIASLSWLFDCMDQRFFNLVREPAMRSLLLAGMDEVPQTPEAKASLEKNVRTYGRYATAMVLLGWAVGGFFFGMMGDRIGRVKTMMITILIYAGFTGLSALSLRWWDFILYRFLMGLGVGGLFAAAVSLVAEVMPAAARPHALGLLQALSTVGNILGSAISLKLNPETLGFLQIANWRWLFVVGVLPALLVVVIQKTLREPESWQRAKTKASQDLHRQLGSWKDLFAPGLRRNTLVGLTLAVSGVIGLWAIAFFSPELIREAMKRHPKEIQGYYVSIGMMLQDVGAFFGVYFFTLLASRFGRKPAFAVCFLLAFAATVITFNYLRLESHVYWMLPLLGFCSLSVFGGYSIYFPELYPTRLRSSGVGLCYNVGRVITTMAIFGVASLVELLRDFGVAEPFRVGSMLIAGIYFLGIAVLFWAPETRGRPLRED